MNFYLPDFYFKSKLNLAIIKLQQTHPEYFYDGVQIKSLFGTFPGAIWNGGRKSLGSTNLETIRQAIKTLNDLGIALRFTFTNSELEEKHCFDTYCNIITEEAHNGKNEILVNSPILESYLRENYPNYKYILSTTTCERDLDKINLLTEKYDLLVIDYRDNIDFNFLNKLKQKEKIELLINAYCYPDCKMRKLHYKDTAIGQLNFLAQSYCEELFTCDMKNKGFLDALKFPTTIKNTDLYEKYTKMGFQHFKIEGRFTNDIDVIESYVYYLIKPEYKDEIRIKLLKTLYL